MDLDACAVAPLSSLSDSASETVDLDQLAHLLSTHRDWRIDLNDVARSFVFVIGGGDVSGVSPIAASSPEGQKYARVFELLAREIQSEHVRLLNDQRGGEPREEDGIRRFAVTLAGVRCRVQHIVDERFHVRVTSELTEFELLGMPAAIIQCLLGPDLNHGGLVAVCGGYGSGKTSTMNAIIRERIRRRGGYALVMGDPIEYRYAGFHGTQAAPGYVEQIDLAGRNLAAELKASMRNFPAGAVSILAFPELLVNEGVGDLLRAANRGSLVFCDMHALNVESAVLNLVAMAEQDGERNARDLLANSLKMILHLRMTPAPASPRGVSIAYKLQMIARHHSAALADPTIPLSRAVTGIVSSPTSGSVDVVQRAAPAR